MLLNVALFSSVLLVPAVLVVPSALGASVAQSQLNSRQAVQPIPDGWAGAIITNDNVRSTGYSATTMDLIHILLYMTGGFQLGHRDVHRPQAYNASGPGFCLRLGWY